MAIKHTSMTMAQEPAWTDVDKDALPPEAFALGTAYPHHFLKDGRLLLHRGALASARSLGDTLNDDAAKHLETHPDGETLRKRAALSMLDYVPPVGVRVTMARGLQLAADGFAGPALSPYTIKRAKQLVKGVATSQRHFKRMAAWFASHASFALAAPNSPAGVAWLLWGGRAGKHWASRQAHTIKQTLSSTAPGRYALNADPDTFVPEGAAVKDSDEPLKQTFRKELIREGLYVHPKTGQVIPVTNDRMEHWLKNHNKRLAKGIDTEVVIDHEDGAEAIRGYLTGMEIEDGKLYGLHEMRGQKAIDLVQTCKNTSIQVEDFIDSDEEVYGETIVHNAIVQRPVVPGQEDFVPVSLSGGQGANGAPVPVYRKPVEKEVNMSILLALQEAMGADGDDFTEELALSTVGELVAGKAASAKQIEGLEADLTEVKAKAEKLQLSVKGAKEPDADVLAERREVITERLSLLVEGGKITPAASKALAGLCDAPLMLSSKIKSKDGKVSVTVMRKVLDIFAANEPVSLSQKSGTQDLKPPANDDIPETQTPEAKADHKERGEAMLKTIR